MRDTTTAFRTEKNKEQNRPVFLYSIWDYDGAGSNLHFAGADEDITFGGITYQAFAIRHEAVGENSSGEIDSVKVVMGNVNLVAQSYLENYDFRGKKMTIKMVWRDLLDDDTAYIEDVYFIDSYTATQSEVVITLKSKLDILDVQLPMRMYARDYCQWKFKSAECGYSGSETSCNKRLQRCRELGNVHRFGGFPGIPSKRLFIA